MWPVQERLAQSEQLPGTKLYTANTTNSLKQCMQTYAAIDSHICEPRKAGAMSQSFLRCRLLRKNARVCGKSFCVSQFNRALSTHDQFLNVSEEVRDAIHTGKPVVALETTIYTHGKCVAIL